MNGETKNNSSKESISRSQSLFDLLSFEADQTPALIDFTQEPTSQSPYYQYADVKLESLTIGDLPTLLSHYKSLVEENKKLKKALEENKQIQF